MNTRNCGNHGVECVHRTTNALSLSDDITVDFGGRRIEMKHSACKTLIDEGTEASFQITPPAAVRKPT